MQAKENYCELIPVGFALKVFYPDFMLFLDNYPICALILSPEFPVCTKAVAF